MKKACREKLDEIKNNYSATAKFHTEKSWRVEHYPWLHLHGTIAIT